MVELLKVGENGITANLAESGITPFFFLKKNNIRKFFFFCNLSTIFNTNNHFGPLNIYSHPFDSNHYFQDSRGPFCHSSFQQLMPIHQHIAVVLEIVIFFIKIVLPAKDLIRKKVRLIPDVILPGVRHHLSNTTLTL